ncbi:SGNH/GDSL hydrolase family protein [Spirosoma areae]
MCKIRHLLLVFVLLIFGLGSLCAQPKTDSVRVLFIGNSYTYGNDLPELLGQLMAAKGVKFGHESVTPGGATLQKQWEDGKAVAAIRRKPWDFVVLQEQSVRPFANRDAFFQYVRLLDAEVRKTGAKTLLYATWAAKATPDEQPKLTEAYQTIGRELGSLVAPVGEAWKLALGDSLSLHGPDGRHPNVAGSYLAGCVLYRLITKGKATGLPRQIIRDGKPAGGLTEPIADSLQKIADKTPID